MSLRSLCVLAACAAVFAAPSFAQTAVAPSPGEIVVSEIMFTPSCGGSQNTSEWFEVTNISTKVLDLNGLYFQDGSIPGASDPTRWFQVLPSVATLPPLFPGRSFVFCRSADPLLNGGMPQVDYAYASPISTPPADKSQVGFSQMNFSSQDPDGMHVTLGASFSNGGTLLASSSYNPAQGPFSPGVGYFGGGSIEMKNLFGTMTVDPVTQVNDPNSALANPAFTFGSCIIGPDWGTPGATNSSDTTVWPMYTYFNDTLNQNTGTITVVGPPTMGGTPLTLKVGNGVASGSYTLGYAQSLFELPIGLFLAGNPGAILLDLNTAAFLQDPGFSFDGAGAGAFILDLPVSPALLGQSYSLQWLAVDPIAFQLLASNGVTFTICD